MRTAPGSSRKNVWIWIAAGIFIAALIALGFIFFTPRQEKTTGKDTRAGVASDKQSDTASYDYDMDALPSPEPIVDDPAEAVPYEEYEDDSSWYAHLSPGKYRLNCVFTPPSSPDEKYACHVTFRYNGLGKPLTECHYTNDVYKGVELDMSGDYTAATLEFAGNAGGSPFEIQTAYMGEGSFAGTAVLGSKKLLAQGNLVKI